MLKYVFRCVTYNRFGLTSVLKISQRCARSPSSSSWFSIPSEFYSLTCLDESNTNKFRV